MKITKTTLKQLIREQLELEQHNSFKTFKVTFQDDRKLPMGWSVVLAGKNKEDAFRKSVSQFENEFDVPPMDMSVNVEEIMEPAEDESGQF